MTVNVATFYIIENHGKDNTFTHAATVGMDERKSLRVSMATARRMIREGKLTKMNTHVIGITPDGKEVFRSRP